MKAKGNPDDLCSLLDICAGYSIAPKSINAYLSAMTNTAINILRC